MTLVRTSRAIAVAAGLALVACAASADVVHVSIDFTNGPFDTAEEKTAYLKKVQQLFKDAGLAGKDAPNKVKIHDSADPPEKGAIKVMGGFGGAEGNMGIAYKSKKKHACVIDVPKINSKIPGASDERKCIAYAQIMAHEIGHMLCATHQCDKTNPTLMNDGRCWNKDDIGKDGVGFNAKSVEQVTAGIKMLKGKKAIDWEFEGELDDEGPEIIEGEDDSDQEGEGGMNRFDPSLTFDFTITGPGAPLYHYAWLNSHGKVAMPLPDAANPDRLLESHDGSHLNLVMIGNQGTPFEGQMFRPSHYFYGGAMYPASMAEHPERLDGPYFSQVTAVFNVPGGPVQMVLNAEPYGAQNGFYHRVVPAPGALAFLGLAGALVARRRR